MKYDGDDRLFPELRGDAVAPALSCRHSRTAPAQRIALIGCFRPRQCGIATFTADTHDHLRTVRPDIEIDVYAMQSSAGDAIDPDVTLAIDEQNIASYRAAAAAINASGARAVWLQHEFGIFGGAAGEMILELVDRVAVPLIVTLHTVLATPNAEQRRVIQRLVARAAKLVVMSDHGRATLVSVYGADPDRIAHIEHGTPDRPFVDHSPLRDTNGMGDRPVLSTFGLLGPGKGLETAIRALPAIAARYPDILYHIVGATHPRLVAAEGEAYRQSLEDLAATLGVTCNIAWDNRFLDTADLLGQIELCDIYLAPYPNLQQVTSGTLAYAVALGRAVVSTPFIHARELLADDVGILLPRADSDAIAAAVLRLLAAPEERRAIRKRAYARGRRTSWSVIARAFGDLVDEIAVAPTQTVVSRQAPALAGLWSLCDDVGIFQHGKYRVPDRAHGYCIDDNARALILVHGRLPAGGGDAGQRALVFASFLQHAWNEDRGAFRNFMGYDRRWLEEEGSEDSNGRALWALGHAAANAASHDMREWALHWFERAAPVSDGFRSPRAHAFALIGADGLLERHPDHREARAIVERAGTFLSTLWKSARRPGWDWFEAGLAYDNARLAEAMIRAGRRLPSTPFEEAGLAALGWLCTKQSAPDEGHFRPPGSEGFGREAELLPFDQQPLEAWATIDACAVAFAATGARAWRNHAENAYAWFLGRNDRGVRIGDLATGRGLDGLGPLGANRNSGAESTLAFHLAHQTMAACFWRGSATSRPAAEVRPKPPALAAA